MARPIIASKLIRSVRNRALIPTDTSVFTDEDILDILNEEVTQGLGVAFVIEVFIAIDPGMVDAA